MNSGLGGRNPHAELGTKDVLYRMVRALEDHGADLPGPLPGMPSELQLVAGTVAPLEFAGRPVNFEYGNTYASLDLGVARQYAEKFCGELYGYAWQAALRLDAMGLRSEVPDWRGWGLIHGINIPTLLRLPPLSIARFQAESGANLSNRQRRMLAGTDQGGRFLATDLTFRLKGQVPADELVGHFLQTGNMPFCLRCVVRANPDAFPGLPIEPMPFDPGASPPKGVHLQFGTYSDCESPLHDSMLRRGSSP